MYQSHFGVIGDPFANVPDTQRFFNGAKRGAVLDALAYAIARGEAIIKVVGEVGTGKTMLCRMLGDTLPATIEVVYLANPSLTPDTILHAIATELHLPNVTPATSKFEVLQSIQSYLLARHANNRQVVMLVEEAQCMPLGTLEEIRLLSNLETHRHKLLQIVLFGQPELDEKLSNPSMRQLRERISHSFRLEPFDLNEVNEYLDFKLAAAGDSGPGLFTRAAGRAIYRYSRGLVRRVNFLADKTLLAAFSENSMTVKRRHVRRAAQDCEFVGAVKWSPKYFVIGCAIALGALGLLRSGELAAPSPADILQSMSIPLQSDEPHTRLAVNPTAVAPSPSLATFEAAMQLASQELNAVKPASTSRSARPIHTIGLADAVALGRLEATRNWTAGLGTKTYTIQIMTTFTNRDGEVGRLERLVNHDSVRPLLSELYLHDGAMNHKPVLVLSYGGFTSSRAARSAVAKLPKELTRYQPLVRSVGSLQAEIGEE